MENNTKRTILQNLIAIQTELKAPKLQYNSFGKYKYRTAEDILEAVKPLLKKYNTLLLLTDDIQLIGDRYYVKATATLYGEMGEMGEIQTSSFAREEFDKKGMDGSQITGASSSYARKYALNGMFLIDDTRDSDTDKEAEENAKLDLAVYSEQLQLLTTRDEINAFWKQNKDLHTNEEFKQLFKLRLNAIN